MTGGGDTTPLDSGSAASHVPALVEQLGDAAYVLDALTLKQQLFVQEYLVDLNASAAARRAGYSKTSAKDSGYENLRKPAIVDAITAVMATRSKAVAVNRSWVMAQLVDAHRLASDGKSAAMIGVRVRTLELIGRHVDVRAFRAGAFGNDGPDGAGDDADLWDLSRLDDEEFDIFERLLAKVTIIRPSAAGTSGEATPAGPGAGSGGPRGD